MKQYLVVGIPRAGTTFIANKLRKEGNEVYEQEELCFIDGIQNYPFIGMQKAYFGDIPIIIMLRKDRKTVKNN